MQRNLRSTFLVTLLIAGPCLLLGQDAAVGTILDGPRLSPGFDIGVDSSGAKRDWLSVDPSNGLRMIYPSNQAWGTVFITVGKPVDPPRPDLDFTDFVFLVVELKGDAGRQIQVGIKSSADPDTGAEVKQTINLTGDWQTQVFPLGGFAGEDLGHLYVPCEFVFSGPQPVGVLVRSVRYVKSIAPGLGVLSLRAQGGSQLGLYINGGVINQATVLNGDRGMHLAVLHEITGEIEELRSYDTLSFSPDRPVKEALDFLNSIPEGRIVLAAVTGYNALPGELTAALQTLFGSQWIGTTVGYNSWAMISRKGLSVPLAESAQYSASPWNTQSIADAKITLASPTSDTVPPNPSFLVNGGAAKAASNRVQLDLTATKDFGSGLSPGGKMQFSNDGRSWSVAKDFASNANWYLDRGQGANQVVARFRDRDGNWSKKVSRSIDLAESGSLVKFPDAVVDAVCVDENGTIYSLTAGAVRLSSDSATTWSDPKQLLPPVASYQPLLGCGGGLVIVLGVEKVFHSSSNFYFNTSRDYGQTWMPLASEIKAGAEIANFTFCGIDNSLYLAWVEGPETALRLMVIGSADLGATWRNQPVNISSADGMKSADFALSATEDGTSHILWSAANSDVLVRRSTDNAATFLSPQVLGNSGMDPSYPYLIGVGTRDVYAGWSPTAFVYAHSSDAGATWTQQIGADSPPCSWNSTFLPTASGQVLLSCLRDESFTNASRYSLYFNRTSPFGGAWLGPIRISSPYEDSGSVYGVPDVNGTAIDARGSTIVLAWEDTQTKVDGDAKGYDIFWSVSNDYGATWLTQNERLTGTLPFQEATLWWLTMGANGKAYTFWKEGSAMYVDIRPVLGQVSGSSEPKGKTEHARIRQARNNTRLRVGPAAPRRAGVSR